MANEEQLAILRQGVDVWNKWREENRSVKIDLSDANLVQAHLEGANLYDADCSNADFYEAQLNHASLDTANFYKANLKQANLINANLPRTNLTLANLTQANLVLTNINGADCTKTNFIGAKLGAATIYGTALHECNFLGAKMGENIFGLLDLSDAVGLDAVVHTMPSVISASTFQNSRGNIPEEFLRGCGLSDWEIETVKLYNPNLNNEEINNIQYKIYELRATQALQISPLFISYSHSDMEFVDKIDKHLTNKGIRFWRDIHDMKAGRIEKQIDRAISQDRTVLLVFSKHSLSSDWVEHEVRKAREMAKNAGKDTLCPVALDDSWKSSPWPARVMEQIKEYNILDFSGWEDDVKFEGMFRKLIDGLELFYKG